MVVYVLSIRDRGIDIIKPLETFCTGTGCAQNNYDATTDKVKTKYILIDVDMSGNVSSLDTRWNEISHPGWRSEWL